MTRTLDQWRALLADIEAATGPRFEFEARVYKLLGEPAGAGVIPPAVTASLDAVVALVEREMPGRYYALKKISNWASGEPIWEGWMSADEVRLKKLGASGIGPALALLAAFARAKVAELEAGT